MKRTLYLIILIATVISAVSYAEVTSKVTKRYTIIAPEIITYYDGNKVIAVKTLTESGEVKSITGRIPDGWVRRYYPDGKLFMETYFKNDRPDGAMKAYFPTGELETTANYKKGRLNGAEKEFFATGALERTDNFVNGRREGVTKMYNDNGTLESAIIYVHGKVNGKCKYYDYDKNGKLVGQEYYVNGEAVK